MAGLVLTGSHCSTNQQLALKKSAAEALSWKSAGMLMHWKIPGQRESLEDCWCLMQNGQKFIAETHKHVVVLFSDIVGFTTLS